MNLLETKGIYQFCNESKYGQCTRYPVSRGPICYNCDQIRDNSFCHRITVCDQNEECYYSEQSRFGSKLITSKCQRSHICDVLRGESTILGRRYIKRDVSTADNCVHCCPSDMCNGNCLGISSTESTKTMLTTTQPANDFSSTESTNTLLTTTQPANALSAGYRFLLMFLENFVPGEDGYEQILISSNSYGWCVIQDNFHNISRNVTISKGINVFNFTEYVKMNSNKIENKSIVIETSKPVSLFAMNYVECTSDGYLAIPTSQCSTHYIVPSFPEYESLIGIGSLHSGTDMHIKLHLKGGTVTVNGHSYHDGDTVNVTLHMYETFQLVSSSDLTGTEVVSTHPVCIVSGKVCPRVLNGYCSHISEMVLPVSQFSTSFIIPVLYTRYHFGIYAIAEHNQTSVTFDHQTVLLSNDSLSNFGYHQYMSSNTTMKLISSTKPILVMLYSTGVSDDPLMMSIPAVSQYLYDYLFAVPDAGFTSYLSVVVRDNGLSGLRLDNNPIVPIPNSKTSNEVNGVRYTSFAVNVTPGAHNMYHVHEEPFGLFVYGTSEQDGYGYPAGIKF